MMSSLHCNKECNTPEEMNMVNAVTSIPVLEVICSSALSRKCFLSAR